MRGCLDAVYKTTKDSNLLEIESKSSPASCSESSPGPGTRSKGKEELAEELRRQSWETRTVTMARVQKAETHRVLQCLPDWHMYVEKPPRTPRGNIELTEHWAWHLFLPAIFQGTLGKVLRSVCASVMRKNEPQTKCYFPIQPGSKAKS